MRIQKYPCFATLSLFLKERSSQWILNSRTGPAQCGSLCGGRCEFYFVFQKKLLPERALQES